MKKFSFGVIVGVIIVLVFFAGFFTKANTLQKSIICQGFILNDENNDGLLDSVGIDIQKTDGTTRLVTTTKPEVLGFFQRLLDAWLGK